MMMLGVRISNTSVQDAFSMDYAELGYRIRLARESASLSQDAVAQRLGLPRSAVSLIEGGKRKVDSLELQAFSRMVGKSVSFFLDDEAAAPDLEEDDPTQVLFSANQAIDISPDRDQIDRFREFHRNFANLARLTQRFQTPYSEEPRYKVFKATPAAAKWMAAKERARLGLSATSPIRDIWGILESEGVRVMAWPLKTPKLGGCFIFSRRLGSFVLIKRNVSVHSVNMLNFVLAHEYCHHLIHRQQRGITCDPGGHYRKPEEYFAQWFAASFLMPEEALVQRLAKYLNDFEGAITAEVVMHLALDFGVSYTAMLNRLAATGVELIDKETRKLLAKQQPKELLARIGRSSPGQMTLKSLPDEYVDMAFEAYMMGNISLDKLADLIEVPIEEAKAQLEARNIPPNLGLDDEWDLMSDIENA
jgi:Zn-dependent peptidase ImmA (M78 family)/transcriptional regulator with XRE-family HTH domain